MSIFPPYDRRSSSRRAAQPVAATGAPAAAPPGDGAAIALPPVSTPPVAAPSATGGVCSNCDAERVGEYCAHCGQHFLEDRLTFRLLAGELWERVSLERGMLRTFREMMTDPGGVARRYTQGQRRRYASPFTYLFVGAALSLLLLQFYEAQMVAWMRRMSTNMVTGEHPIFTPAQHEAYAQMSLELSRQTTYTGLAIGALFACMLRLFFRRSGINLVESFVFALYTFGHVYYLALPITAIAVLWLGEVSLAMYATFPLYLIVCSLAGAQYFGQPVRSALKTAAALVAAYFLFSIVMGAVLIGYALQAA